MALTCPTNFNTGYLREQVMATYDQVAREPEADYHFHRGPEYASQYLGYDYNELKSLPSVATARFAGVGNPTSIGPIKPGQVVLDHACGAGMDLLLAARKVGRLGKAIGVDMTPAMRDCAITAAELAGFSDVVDIRSGIYEELPVEDKTIDVVISNGVLNLAPDKHQVFNEIYRVLKPGGFLYLSDVIVQRELNLEARSNPDLWAACVGGALLESELIELASVVGLIFPEIRKRYNCFLNTSAEQHVSKDLFVHSVDFISQKGV